MVEASLLLELLEELLGDNPPKTILHVYMTKDIVALQRFEQAAHPHHPRCTGLQVKGSTRPVTEND
jgi:hypothetical protein